MRAPRLSPRVQLALAAALFVAVRIAAVAGRPIERFTDSPGYLRLVPSGRDTRLWPVPLIYSVCFNDIGRVVANVALGCAAWLLLAHAIRRTAPRMEVVAPAVVLVLGVSPPVTRWDLAILSESIGISIAVATFACWLLVAENPRNTARWVGALGATAVFGMTRPSQIFVMVLAGFAATTAVAGVGRRRLVAIVASAFAVMTTLGLVMLSNNQPVSTLNFYTVLSDVVLSDPDHWEWFADHGMPWDETFTTARGYVTQADVSPDLLRYVRHPAGQPVPELLPVGGTRVARWVLEDGWSTYVRWLATHPGETIFRELDRLPSVLNPSDSALLPLSPRRLVPRVVFADWTVLAAGATTLLAVARRRGQRDPDDRRTFVPLVTLGLCVPWCALIGVASGIERPRHAITMAIIFRVALLATAVVAWDRLPRPVRAARLEDDDAA